MAYPTQFHNRMHEKQSHGFYKDNNDSPLRWPLSWSLAGAPCVLHRTKVEEQARVPHLGTRLRWIESIGRECSKENDVGCNVYAMFHINTPPTSIKHTSPPASSTSEVLRAQFTTRDLASLPLHDRWQHRLQRAQPRSGLHKSFLQTLNGWHNLCRFGELQRRCEVSMWRTSQRFLCDCGFLQFWNLVVFQMEEIMFSTRSFLGWTTHSIISTSLTNCHSVQESRIV